MVIVSSATEVRSARPKALREIAVSRHALAGCSHAPLPGSRAAASTTTRPSRATNLTSEDRGARCRQPRQVLTGSMVPLRPGCLLFHHRIGLDIDPRAGQFCSQSRILPLLADRQRKLVIGDERANRLEVL